MGYGPGGEKYGDWREDEEGKKIMAKETDVNFDYIPGKRYIVEIKDEQTGEVYYSERISVLSTAKMLKDGYNALKDYLSKIHDTQTGKII